MFKNFIKNWKYSLLVFLLMTISSGLWLFASISLVTSINSLVQNNIYNAFLWIIFYFLSWIIRITVIIFQKYFYEKLVRKIVLNYRRYLSKEISKINLLSFETKNIGDYASWFINDLDIVKNKGILNATEFVENIIDIIIITIALAFLNHWILILVFVFVLLSITFPFIFKNQIEKINLRISKNQEKNSSKTVNLLSGFNTFLFFNQMFIFKKTLDFFSKKLKIQTIENERKLNVISYVNSLYLELFYYVLLLVAGVLIIYDYAEIGSIFVIREFASRYLISFQGLSLNKINIGSANKIVEKWKELLNESNYWNKKNFDQKINEIELKDINLAFGNQTIFENLNLKFSKGKKYLIVGNSGKGKSTIIKILAGIIIPNHGKILVNNKEINNFQTILNKISYVDNSGVVLDNDLLNNTVLWKNEHNSTLLEKSLNVSQVNFLLGKKTNLTDLSTGQKQRLAIARGLYQNKEILVFDEAMSNIDKATSESIENEFLSNPNLTFIHISHNFNEANKQKYDQIIYL